MLGALRPLDNFVILARDSAFSHSHRRRPLLANKHNNVSGHAKKWIQGAHLKEGALTAKADAAGESPMAFAHSHESAPGKTGKQARLAVTLSKLGKK